MRQPTNKDQNPDLVLRELVVPLVLVAVSLVFSTFINAPLQGKANPGLSPSPAKAPWYFMGFQEMLLHFHPVVAIFIIPLLVAAALIGLPYLKYDANTAGVWFQSLKGRLGKLAARHRGRSYIVGDQGNENQMGEL